MAAKKGSLSINSDNIFPIIKKWLYSDHDIFYRELISNGCDAITKLKKLDMMGEYELPEGYKPRIDVIVNPEKKTLTFKDNGLGMTADEVEEYINQIALIPYPTRKAQSPYTGNVTAVRNFPWRTVIRQKSAPPLLCS